VQYCADCDYGSQDGSRLSGCVRFADALCARKQIVITGNPMCQLPMADHERTCLVVVIAGVDLRMLQELMGHKTMAMTLRYSHLSPGHQVDPVQ